jgi:hypothetical protein
VRTGSRMLELSAAFGIAVAAAYWAVSHEPAGTALLGTMGLGLGFAALYIGRHARRAALPADRPDIRPEEVAGRRVGAFPTSSSYPVVLAAGIALFAAGIFYGWWLALPGALLASAAIVGWMRESRDVEPGEPASTPPAAGSPRAAGEEPRPR